MGSVRFEILAANHSAAERDAIVMRAVQNGQVPNWVSHNWTSLTIVDDKGNALELFFMRDALAILDDDGSVLYIPVRIATAQAIADHLGAVIVTPKMVDAIFHDSRCQRVPFQGIPGLFTSKDPVKLAADELYMQSSDAMLFHSDSVNSKADRFAPLVMGHSKCLAIGPKLSRLGIYGGYGGTVNGWAIQSYPGPHDAEWCDYSQLLNLCSLDCVFNGSKVRLDKDIFERADRVGLVDYGASPFTPRWPTNGASVVGGGGFVPGAPPGASTPATGGRRMLDRSSVGLGGANLGEALFTSFALPVLSALAQSQGKK